MTKASRLPPRKRKAVPVPTKLPARARSSKRTPTGRVAAPNRTKPTPVVPAKTAPAPTGRIAPATALAAKVKLPPSIPAPPKRATKPKPVPAVDPFDATPSLPATAPRIPGAYVGHYDGEGNHVCIAYKRTETKVFTLLMAQPIRILEWDPEIFDAQMRPCLFKGEAYPLDRAVRIYRESYNGHTDKALRILNRLATGRDVDEENTLEDLLDMTPSRIPGRPRVKRQALPTDERKLKRRKARQARLAAMTPAERKVWQDQRNARRKARRLARKQG